MAELNYVSSSPHIRSKDSTANIMRDVLIGLTPATLIGFYQFGWPSVINVLLAVCSAIGFEYLFRRLVKRNNTISDYSAAVTGLLLGLNLPAGHFYLAPIIGSFFAIVVVKQLFGGLGQNFMNPALAARVFLLVSYGKYMTTWPSVDGVASATPLSFLKHNDLASVSLIDNLTGTIGGSIGEVSAIALLVGGIYLLIRRVITYDIPLSYLLSFSLMMLIFGQLDGHYLILHLTSGGLMMGAFFMATDYSSSPMTKKGQWVMGIGCGIITAVIRLYSGYPEGVSFAIIIMNLFVPLIDYYTVPISLGGAKR